MIIIYFYFRYSFKELYLRYLTHVRQCCRCLRCSRELGPRPQRAGLLFPGPGIHMETVLGALRCVCFRVPQVLSHHYFTWSVIDPSALAILCVLRILSVLLPRSEVGFLPPPLTPVLAANASVLQGSAQAWPPSAKNMWLSPTPLLMMALVFSPSAVMT